MAELARRTWAQIKSATSARIGRTGDTAFEASGGVLEHALADAYFDLALTFFHHELVERATVAAPAANFNATDISSVGAYLVMNVSHSVDGAFTRSLQQTDLRELVQRDRSTVENPTRWARADDKILFDTTSVGGAAAHTFDLLYYADPTPPDFATSATSELSRVWDERIIQAALAILFPAAWRFDMASVQAERLKDFTDRSVHLPLGALMLPEDSTGRSGRPLGGPAG
jgi:hypothetical protein